MNEKDFYKTTLDFESNLFNELSSSIKFEQLGKGRLGNQLVKPSSFGVPIVRTTTRYTIPTHTFSDIHRRVIESINSHLEDLSLNFNNALIEVYDSEYFKMGYHSDQCLDLLSGSYIGLFSCYENPDELTAQSIRKLKIKNKESSEEFDIALTHNSFILFSLATNSKFLHKIVLERIPKQKPLASENRWLGITFRTSKTFINFEDGLPYLENGDLLRLATEEEEREYFKLRGEENRSVSFRYPQIEYTISEADRVMPLTKEKI